MDIEEESKEETMEVESKHEVLGTTTVDDPLHIVADTLSGASSSSFPTTPAATSPGIGEVPSGSFEVGLEKSKPKPKRLPAKERRGQLRAHNPQLITPPHHSTIALPRSSTTSSSTGFSPTPPPESPLSKEPFAYLPRMEDIHDVRPFYRTLTVPMASSLGLTYDRLNHQWVPSAKQTLEQGVLLSGLEAIDKLKNGAEWEKHRVGDLSYIWPNFHIGDDPEWHFKTHPTWRVTSEPSEHSTPSSLSVPPPLAEKKRDPSPPHKSLKEVQPVLSTLEGIRLTSLDPQSLMAFKSKLTVVEHGDGKATRNALIHPEVAIRIDVELRAYWNGDQVLPEYKEVYNVEQWRDPRAWPDDFLIDRLIDMLHWRNDGAEKKGTSDLRGIP